MNSSRPVLFLFLAGVIDVLVTMIVVFTGWGYEMTEVYNWISPSWLMFLYMIVVNLVFCLGLLFFHNTLAKNNTHIGIQCSLISLTAFLYGAGFARLLFGAGSGVAIIMDVAGLL